MGKGVTAVVEVSNSTEEGLEVGKVICMQSDSEEGGRDEAILNGDSSQQLNRAPAQLVQSKGKATTSKKKAPVRKLIRTLTTKNEVVASASVTEVAVGLVAASEAARQRGGPARLLTSPIKKRGQSKSPVQVVAEDVVERSLAKRESQTKPVREKKTAPSKFQLGQQVLLMNPKSTKQAVASGVISGLGGKDEYHFIEIPALWFKVDVKEAIWPHVSLMFPNENADQVKLKDVVRSNTLWDGKYIKLAK